MRRQLGINTFDAAVERLIGLYAEGHRIVCCFSGGKDSGVCLELCLFAAKETGRLPVEVAMRDEEIMFPGTFEYSERVAARDDVDFHWMLARQPVINIFNRESPYFWVFDPEEEDKWVREPPSIAYDITENHIQGMVTPERFPPPAGLDLFTVIGLRTIESPNRLRGLHSSGGWLTKPNRWGSRFARPIYDWTDGDVWKAMGEYKWDYNSAYDVMHRHGHSRKGLRIAPPTMTTAGISLLQTASRAWPQWFDRVCTRLPGVRTSVMFGRRALEPVRKHGELWSQTFQRECIDEAPPWVGERCARISTMIIKNHRAHSTQPYPEAKQCVRCGVTGSWMRLTKDFYMGDPFSLKWGKIDPVDPEVFRAGAGTWGGGKPSW